MTLREFAKQRQIDSPLLEDSFWSLTSDRVGPGDIQMFYARNRSKIGECASLLDQLQSALIIASFDGTKLVATDALLTHEPVEDPFFMDEFLDLLGRTPHTWQLATVFALETVMEPRDVAELTWRATRSLKPLNAVAGVMMQLTSAQRHPRLPYVFWEWVTPSIAAPLLSYPDTIEERMGMTWPKLARLYGEMVLIDTSMARMDLFERHRS